MKNLNTISQEASDDIKQLLKSALDPDDLAQMERIVEKAVIKGLLEGQHRAIDAAMQCPEAEQDMAHNFATAIRRKNDALIANLVSMR